MKQARDLLDWAVVYLKQKDIESPRQNGEVLLSHLLDCSRTQLYIGGKPVTEDVGRQFNLLIAERTRNRPIQHITGKACFMGLDFVVTEDCFIPRPETEVLVETVLKLVTKAQKPITILDIGTGCGNIAISLAKYIPNCRVIATDISEKAVRIARKNAKLHQVEDRVKFLVGDLFRPLGPKRGSSPDQLIDIIVSNPPYIPFSDLASLPKEVKREPLIALDGKTGGLKYLREIIAQGANFLKKEGYLVMEMGAAQAPAMKRIVLSGERFNYLEIIRDYNARERIVVAHKT